MNRKSSIAALCIVLALLLANGVALFFLYAPARGTRILRGGDGDTTAAVGVTSADTEQTHLSAGSQAVAEADESKPATTSVTEGVAQAPAAAERTENPKVVVPAGPFKVKNCATGLMNSLCQAADNSLTLTDQKGVELWTVPFDGPLCGMVGTVDYFANGKLQFLMVSGDRLFLIDRLGREVEGFPAALAKPVLLGPAVYDFTGIRKYNIMVLNTDNTIDMYNLKGRRPDNWHSISLPETILGLPEYSEKEGKSFWTVRTASGAYLYDFYGNPVKQ